MPIHSRSFVLVAVPCLAAACVAGADPRPSGTETLGATSSPTSAATDPSESSASAPSSSSASPSTSAADGQDTAPAEGTSTTASASSGSGTTAGPADVCDGIAGERLVPPSACDGPGGYTSTEIPPNGLYSTSWFGCYFDDDGSIVQDPGDNCEFACGSQGLCPRGQDGPSCEANLRWFAADADRYGCGGRIRVTNCENGNAVVLVTLDRGPNCNSVEMACDTPVLDMSHDAMGYLFDGSFYGGCEHQAVVVEAVDPGTPLGPV